MKIIFINRFYYPDYSATSQLLSELTFGLARAGYNVNVVTSRLLYDNPKSSLPGKEVIKGVNVIRPWTIRVSRNSLIARFVNYVTFYLAVSVVLLRMVRKGDIVVTETDPPLMSVISFPIVKLKQAKHINWLQDLFPEVAYAIGVGRTHTPLDLLIKLLRNFSLKKSSANIVLGSKMQDLLRTQGIDSGKISIIPNWSDELDITPTSVENNALRNSWQLTDKFVVGYSGNFGRVHEFQTIIAAIHKLDGGSNFHFLFIGGGYHRHKVESQLLELGVKAFSFKPYQPRNVLSLSLSVPDVHIITLKPEMEGLVFPSKLYGVLAAGRPAIFIGSKNGEIAQILGENHCGLAVEQGDTEGLVDALLSLASQPALCREMGNRARMLFEERYSRSIALEKWCRILDPLYQSQLERI